MGITQKEILIDCVCRSFLPLHRGGEAHPRGSQHLLEDRREQQAGEVCRHLHQERHRQVRTHTRGILTYSDADPYELLLYGSGIQDPEILHPDPGSGNAPSGSKEKILIYIFFSPKLYFFIK